MVGVLGLVAICALGDSVDFVTGEQSAITGAGGFGCFGQAYGFGWQSTGRIAKRKTYVINPGLTPLDLKVIRNGLGSYRVDLVFRLSSGKGKVIAWKADGEVINVSNYAIPQAIVKELTTENLAILVRGPIPCRKPILFEAENFSDLVAPEAVGEFDFFPILGAQHYYQIKGSELWSWCTVPQNHRDVADLPFFLNGKTEWPGLLSASKGAMLKLGNITAKVKDISRTKLTEGLVNDSVDLLFDDETCRYAYGAAFVYKERRDQGTPPKFGVVDEGFCWSNIISASHRKAPNKEWAGIKIKQAYVLDGYFGNVAMKPLD